jgi:hypothetical protein
MVLAEWADRLPFVDPAQHCSEFRIGTRTVT